jgi:hypothetical protein
MPIVIVKPCTETLKFEKRERLAAGHRSAAGWIRHHRCCGRAQVDRIATYCTVRRTLLLEATNQTKPSLLHGDTLTGQFQNISRSPDHADLLFCPGPFPLCATITCPMSVRRGIIFLA